MKKSIVVACILAAMLLSCNLVGCRKTSNARNDVSSDSTTLHETVASSTEDPLPGYMRDCQLTIERFEKGVNAHNENIIVITYNFRNLSVDPVALIGTDLDIDVFQNGIEVQEAYISEQIPDNIECDFSSCSKEVLPGYSISCQRAYILNDPTSNVQVHVSRFFDDFYKLQYEIEI